MSAYIGRTYTMTVSGTVSRRERCCHCSTAFEYEICRNGMGNGHSPFLLLNSGAKQTAERRARKALQRAFVGAVEPVHCPTCGMYQPEMVPELERQFGVRFDPNEYAAERVTIPFNVIWKKTHEADTVEAYERFMRVWPRHADHAKLRLRELLGIYQPEMVPELERRFGVRFDPNEYAAERVTIPFNVIWKKMVEAYERFMRIWPRHADHAKLRLRELRHPVRRKVLRVLSWTVWGMIAVGFAGLVLLSILGELKVIKL
jgi:hypothetical protein